ncbi:MAG: tetratricopeptide repeat protein [Flavobacteriaceae bacterium]|nr:tetratricopeptide repeat protein [Flavobacteriaceae bacterium]
MRNILLLLLLITQSCKSQTEKTDFKTKFIKYYEENNTDAQLQLLTKWEKSKPNDAELFTSYFNYYFKKSRNEIIALSTEQTSKETLALKNSLGEISGFLGSQITYDNLELDKGIEYINKGIKKHPNRLDMRFGKIHVLGLRKNWKTFTNEIIKAVEYSNKNSNNWTWTDNKEIERPKQEYFLGNIQTYINQLYNTGDDNLLVNMRDISTKILEFHPKHIPSLSNVSITYILIGNYEKGIKPLLKAEKIEPKDFIVLSNIAQAYKLMGNTKTSIEYYNKIVDIGDIEAKEFAENEIKKLEKK